MGWLIPIEPIDISAELPVGGAYQDCDVSTLLPVGTKQIWFRLRNTGSATTLGVRPKGSTFISNYKVLATDCCELHGVKLDTNRVFEIKLITGYSLSAHVIAYSDEDTLMVDPIDMSLASTGSYQEQSDGSIPNGAGLVFLESVMNVGSLLGGYRPYGETYDYYKTNLSNYRSAILVGLDNRRWEQKISGIALDCHLWGHLLNSGRPTGVPTDFAPTVGSWQDVDLSGVLPADALAAIFQVINTSGTAYGVGFRHPDSVEDLTADIDVYGNHQRWMIVGVDSNRHCEIWLENTAVECRLVGWLINQSSSTENKSPGIAASVDRNSKTAWSNPNNSKVEDAQVTDLTLPATEYSDWLRVTDFGFTSEDIPVGSEIVGIEVGIKRSADVGDQISDDSVKLRTISGQVGEDKKSDIKWPIVETFQWYGSVDDLWATLLTREDILSGNFGVDISVKNNDAGNSRNPKINNIKVKIYYTGGGRRRKWNIHPEPRVRTTNIKSVTKDSLWQY